jgi:hypothetical protein
LHTSYRKRAQDSRGCQQSQMTSIADIEQVHLEKKVFILR